MPRYLLLPLVLALPFLFAEAFVVCPHPSHSRASEPSTTWLRLLEDDQDVIYGGSNGLLDDSARTLNDATLLRSFKNRQDALLKGIGKRYVTRTQKGFLNIHYEPTDPHDIENVVGQLQEGQIVTSTGPMRGFWIPHDGGGWSISKFGGFTWLEPIDE